MKMMNELVWLPPLLFILHDMEEIVWALAWKRGEMGRKRYLQMRFTPFGTADSTCGFSFCVYEELLILTAASLLGRCCGFYGLWFGLLAANILHLVVLHLVGTTLVYRSYVLGLVTAGLTVIPAVWVLIRAERLLGYTGWQLTAWVVLGVAIAGGNLRFLHRRASKIGAWVERSMADV